MTLQREYILCTHHKAHAIRLSRELARIILGEGNRLKPNQVGRLTNSVYFGGSGRVHVGGEYCIVMHNVSGQCPDTGRRSWDCLVEIEIHPQPEDAITILNGALN